MADGLLTHVGVPSRPSSIRCKKCRKKLTVDTGITVEGLPGAWAKCWPHNGGCGMVLEFRGSSQLLI